MLSFGTDVSPDSAGLSQLKAKEKAAQEYSTGSRRLRYEQDSKWLETLRKLDSLNSDTDSLEQAMLCLDATCRTLGKVKTAFTDLRMFMDIISARAKAAKKHADSLAEISVLEMTEGDEFLAGVRVWASLGGATLKAKEIMVAASKEADDKMNILPEANASKEKVKAWTATMLRKLKRHAEDVQLQDPKRPRIS
mmetsp:Transcript_60566/g.187647  ORF Transcript_60566/g.187647 Transcript_60566/m.187647 type:complete len:194 (+) Transcript_60566:914-1495(+)